MDKRIVYNTPDGSTSIIIPAPKARHESETDADFLKRIALKDVPKIDGKILAWEIIDASILPEDRYFRNAWNIKNGKVTIDMERARNVHMDAIRRVRDEKLKELDLQTLKGIDVQKEKQELRDIPQTFDLSGAITPDELKELIPNNF